MVILQISFFFTIFIVLLFGSHYLLYFSLVKFFPFFGAHKNGLIITLSILALSFFLSLALAHWKESAITRAFYFLSGFWLGFLVNLLLAILCTWIVIWLTSFFSPNINMTILASVLFGLAFLISIYGAWNATQPKIKNITITIPHLPGEWQGKKIVQLSDVHLGLLYQAAFMQNIVKKTNAENPEMVLITGDLFDGMDGNLDSLVLPLNNLEAPHGTFFVNGNHETYLGTAKAFSALEKTKVKILNDQVVDVDGLKLIGIGYPERDLKKDVVATLQKLKPQFFGSPNILLCHSPTNIKQFAENGVNLQLSGHTHVGQIFPFNFITKLIYHGYDYGLHQIGNYALYTSSGVGTWGPTMRTDSNSEIVVITLENKVD